MFNNNMQKLIGCKIDLSCKLGAESIFVIDNVNF